MTAWSRKIWKCCEKSLRFLETRPLMEKILKILFRTLSPSHRSTLLCSNVVKFVWREIGEIVRYLPDRKKKQIFGCLSNCHFCAGCAKICQDQPPTINSQCSRFHPNLFIFGSYIWTCEHRFLPHKLNPLFTSKRSTASRQIINNASTIIFSKKNCKIWSYSLDSEQAVHRWQWHHCCHSKCQINHHRAPPAKTNFDVGCPSIASNTTGKTTVLLPLTGSYTQLNKNEKV